jgi:4-carboxymuconolactone decarboxylase
VKPADIDPESGCRLPLPKREELDEAAQAIYDRLATPGSGNLRGLRGPGGIQLHSPELSRRSRPVNHYLRFESGLSGRVRELAILVTARAHDSQFEWAAHEAEALKEGVAAEAIEIVRHGGGAEVLAEEDAIVIALCREMFERRTVSPETFARALARFEPTGLVNLVALMGHYAATAALLTAFDMQLDEGVEPPLPVPGGAPFS